MLEKLIQIVYSKGYMQEHQTLAEVNPTHRYAVTWDNVYSTLFTCKVYKDYRTGRPNHISTIKFTDGENHNWVRLSYDRKTKYTLEYTEWSKLENGMDFGHNRKFCRDTMKEMIAVVEWYVK